MGEVTIVGKSGRGWLKTTIPISLARVVGIEVGDTLDWDIELRDGEKVLVVRKRPRQG